jgi:hypothetical protein
VGVDVFFIAIYTDSRFSRFGDHRFQEDDMRTAVKQWLGGNDMTGKRTVFPTIREVSQFWGDMSESSGTTV